MKREIHIAGLLVLILVGGRIGAEAGTLLYSYDEEHRLSGVSYHRSASQSEQAQQAAITYEYDDAHNLKKYEVLTDSKFLSPFLLRFAWLKNALRYFCQGQTWI